MLVGCNTYKKFDMCVEMIKSAQNGTHKPEQILIWDNSGGGFIDYVRSQDIEPNLKGVAVINNPVNEGCAKPWNKMLELFYNGYPDEWVCIVNDDIIFYEDALELLQEAINKRTDNDVIFVAGGIASPNAFSLFCTRFDILKDKVGLFDEFYKYPYCEDGKMYLDLKRAGLDLTRVEGVSATHAGSATLAAYNEQEQLLHHAWFDRNAEYFYLQNGIYHMQIHEGNHWPEEFKGDPMYKEQVQRYIIGKYGA